MTQSHSTLSDQDRTVLQQTLQQDAPTWIEEFFYVPDPRDPITGEQLPPGPIRLAEYQKKILRHALVKVDGKFVYNTIVYSTIKKSGKTALAAGVGAWYAATQAPFNEIYCLANDGKQSKDRILGAVYKAVRLNPNLDWTTTKTRIDLPERETFIEAIPCDAAGQAGANPGLTIWSEMWGFRHDQKERLWTEMTIPPTRYGHAIRWVESYAGYEGESNVLWNLYQLGVKQGFRHPAFPDLPVYVNPTAQLFCYWDEGIPARRMPWQRGPEGRAYYAAEATTNVAAEFTRIHMNQWVSPLTKAIPIEWWDACQDIRLYEGRQLPPIGKREPIVLAVDAAISGDSCAVVALSRNPFLDKRKDKLAYREQAAVRAVRIWTPQPGHKMDLDATIGKTIREFRDRYNVVEVAYDEYQLHELMTRTRRTCKVRAYAFPQMGDRNKADKALYDMIVAQNIVHGGNAELRQHVDNASAKLTGGKYRFEKMDTSKTRGVTVKPIDALVATSMGAARVLKLNI